MLIECDDDLNLVVSFACDCAGRYLLKTVLVFTGSRLCWQCRWQPGKRRGIALLQTLVCHYDHLQYTFLLVWNMDVVTEALHSICLLTLYWRIILRSKHHVDGKHSRSYRTTSRVCPPIQFPYPQAAANESLFHWSRHITLSWILALRYGFAGTYHLSRCCLFFASSTCDIFFSYCQCH